MLVLGNDKSLRPIIVDMLKVTDDLKNSLFILNWLKIITNKIFEMLQHSNNMT